MNFIENSNILNIYHYGSYVYGTHNENSDFDFIFIIKDEYKPNFNNITYSDFNEPINIKELILDKKYINCQIKFITLSTWKKMLDNCDIVALEVIYMEKCFIIKELIKPNFNIDFSKIRENISKTASNSFVKCKKKLELTNEYRIGKKSLWHSLRLLMFGNQIMKYGKIIDYSEANIYYNDIVNNSCNDWTFYKNNYQQIYNNLKTQFKINHFNAIS